MTAPRRIAYQGEPGANSHQVCLQHYPEAEALACASFEDVFAAVEGGEADLAMIPIDNSIAGRVADIHHFLPDSGLHIVAEHFLRIRFQLLGVPGARLEDVRTVHSHVHALGQCRKIIRAHNLTPVISGDTARRRPRDRGGGGPRPGGDLPTAGRRDLRARGARRGRRGRGPQHHPLRRAQPRAPSRPRPATARWSRRSSSTSATCPPRSTRRSEALRPTAST